MYVRMKPHHFDGEKKSLGFHCVKWGTEMSVAFDYDDDVTFWKKKKRCVSYIVFVLKLDSTLLPQVNQLFSCNPRLSVYRFQVLLFEKK